MGARDMHYYCWDREEMPSRYTVLTWCMELRALYTRTKHIIYLFLNFSRQGFSVALEPVLELALVDQVGLELTEICLLLPLKCWG